MQEEDHHDAEPRNIRRLRLVSEISQPTWLSVYCHPSITIALLRLQESTLHTCRIAKSIRQDPHPMIRFLRREIRWPDQSLLIEPNVES
ncbi:unnamed protein product [Periconia digitata]|uniref:Uncharacterized protein n=1 Tax=Periconia digitata TaxID=1303443 RepID=A0A9W4XX80_9PLEO|nr:unnamed protein product [Periconia digitata]